MGAERSGCRFRGQNHPDSTMMLLAWNDLPEAIRKAMLAGVEVRNTSRETPIICEA